MKHVILLFLAFFKRKNNNKVIAREAHRLIHKEGNFEPDFGLENGE